MDPNLLFKTYSPPAYWPGVFRHSMVLGSRPGYQATMRLRVDDMENLGNRVRRVGLEEQAVALGPLQSLADMRFPCRSSLTGAEQWCKLIRLDQTAGAVGRSLD